MSNQVYLQDLLHQETDRDVLHALQVAINALDEIETLGTTSFISHFKETVLLRVTFDTKFPP